MRALIGAGDDVNALDQHGQNALMRAAHGGQLALVQVLLAHGAALDRTAKFGLSALMLAIIAGHEAIACRLVDAGADTGLLGTGAAGFAGRSALDLARAGGLVRITARLRHVHAQCTPTNANSDLAAGVSGCDVVRIHQAFKRGDIEMLRAALPDPGVVPNGRLHDAIGCCLVYAIYHSPPAFVRALLNLGAVVDASCEDGFPPLIAALGTGAADADSGDGMEKFAMLLDAGANPDVRGLNDYTPLHVAVVSGNRRAVMRLLQAGADPRSRTRIDEQVTPGELARESGHGDLAALLSQWGG